MADISNKMDEVMQDEAFAKSLEGMETGAEVEAAFAAKGIDVKGELGIGGESEELSTDQLEDVQGGIATLAAAVVLGWKVGSGAGILARAYYDAQKYGNPYRTYSKSTVDGLLKKLRLL